MVGHNNVLGLINWRARAIAPSRTTLTAMSFPSTDTIVLALLRTIWCRTPSTDPSVLIRTYRGGLSTLRHKRGMGEKHLRAALKEGHGCL